MVRATNYQLLIKPYSEILKSIIFLITKIFIVVIKTLADLITVLEKAKTKIVDIVVEFLKLHVYYIKLTTVRFNPNLFAM